MMKIKHILSSTAIAVTVSTMAMAASAFAQDRDAAADDRSDNVIVVTATKREQTLQEVPIAVSVTSGETIERAQIQDISDLQAVVPSLRVAQLQSSNQTNFIIRGFGNGANAIGVEPSVGVFIDGVYRSRSGSAISDLPNVQRVEVLRGPQSTLFGKNASAGVISIVTKSPEYNLGASIEATIGNYDQRLIKGFVTAPISENVAFSLSGSYSKRDGYIENLQHGGSLNERNRWALRGQLLFEPTDNLTLRFIADHDELNEDCCGAPNIISGPATGIVQAVGGNVNPANPFDYQVFINEDLYNRIENNGVSLQADVGFDGFSLTSISSYRNNKMQSNVDVDFTGAAIFGGNPLEYDIDTYTQELRLASDGSGRLNWMVGGFYFYEKVDQNQTIAWGSDARPFFDRLFSGISPTLLSGLETMFMLPNGTSFEAGRGMVESAGQTNKAISVFGQVDFEIVDNLIATGGINYTNDRKSAYFRQTANTNIFDTLPLGALSGLQFFPPSLNFPNNVEDGRSNDSKVTWTARLAYNFDDRVNVYASAASGFKATSWNLTRDSRPFLVDQADLTAANLLQPNQTFGGRFAEPENTRVYEVGVKGNFEGINFNLAAFYQNIKNFQTTIFTGNGFQFANAEEQSTMGFEFDVSVQPTHGLTFNFAGTILDPTFDSFTQSAAGDISGQTPAGIHKVSLSVGGMYEFQLTEDIGGYLRTDYLHESKARLAENVPATVTREVNTVNVSLGFDMESGWGLQFWGRNVFKDTYLLAAFPSPGQTGNFNGYPNQPRTYGATLRKKF